MQVLIAAMLTLLLAAAAQAHVVELRLIDQQDFAGGASFGAAGPYVLTRAVARGELDPADPAHAVISMLKLAPRNDAGRVEYEADVFVLRPANLARSNGVLLYDVTSDGSPSVPGWLGEPFALDRGYTIAWSGWQPEARSPLAGIRVPTVRWADLPIVQRIRFEFRADEDTLRIALPYKVANIEHTRLTERLREADPRTTVPIEDWRFVDTHAIQLAPYPTRFKHGVLYDLYYDATQPSVNGIGFAAVRDVAAYLRHQEGLTHALAFGASLGGRFLRHLLELGMNRGEDGAPVFDGMLIHAAGAGKTFANEAFAQPSRSAGQHEDHWYPETWEPVGYAGLLRGTSVDPLVIATNTSTDYWQKAASAVHGDGRLPARVRAYLIAGTQHDSRRAPSAGECAGRRNPASAAPALRALLVALENWAVHGIAPPPSEVPRRVNGTGVPAEAIRMPAAPGVLWAKRDNKVPRDKIDWVDPPPDPVRTYATFVPAVDADGNEVAGIRLPHVAVPLGTYTGVNVYRDLPDELCGPDGMLVPFARSRAERERSGDPRPSLQERYGSRNAYVGRVRETADALVARRLLLREDADAYVAAAGWADRF